jgi:adenylate kinase
MLRAAVQEGSPMGLKAKALMDKGALVPDEVVVGIVRERLGKVDCGRGFILDGFPRTVAQADALEETLGNLGKDLDQVISLEVDREAVVERIAGRRTCRQCGKMYHVKFDPPALEGRCDSCAGDLYLRDDDREETVRKRLGVYQEQTAPLIDYYRNKKLLCEIDGMQEIGKVQKQILSVLGC